MAVHKAHNLFDVITFFLTQQPNVRGDQRRWTFLLFDFFFFAYTIGMYSINEQLFTRRETRAANDGKKNRRKKFP